MKGDKPMQLRVISLIVSNKSGVLNRIFRGLSAAGDITSKNITVGVTGDPCAFPEWTIVVKGRRKAGSSRSIKQLDKLIDVKRIKYIPDGNGTFRELALVKSPFPTNDDRMHVMKRGQ